MVDAKNPGWGQPILDKIKELTPKPVTTLINTHTHGDHVSGNVEFPATVEVVAQENTKVNMEKMPIFKEHNNVGLPKRTFKDKMTLGTGADQIDLYYFGRGHTNGDAFVVFPALRVAHAGDIFAGKTVPLIDEANGGSMAEISDSLLKAYNGIKNVDTIINGHMPTQTTWADLKEYSDFNKDLVAWMQSELKAGKTPAQAAAEWKLPEKYKGYSSTVGPTVRRPRWTYRDAAEGNAQVASVGGDVRVSGRRCSKPPRPQSWRRRQPSGCIPPSGSGRLPPSPR